MYMIREPKTSKQNFNAPRPETLEPQHEASTHLIRELEASK
jgi:hypothetical protein